MGAYTDHGSEGQVFRGKYLFADVALKEVLSTSMSDNEDLEDFAAEVELLSSVSNHPHIVDFIGITQCTTGMKKLFAVTTSCEMNLREYLVRGPQCAGFCSDENNSYSLQSTNRKGMVSSIICLRSFTALSTVG